jgi:hypothetical protein
MLMPVAENIANEVGICVAATAASCAPAITGKNGAITPHAAPKTNPSAEHAQKPFARKLVAALNAVLP